VTRAVRIVPDDATFGIQALVDVVAGDAGGVRPFEGAAADLGDTVVVAGEASSNMPFIMGDRVPAIKASTPNDARVKATRAACASPPGSTPLTSALRQERSPIARRRIERLAAPDRRAGCCRR
jgi:hypothetical protein